MRTGRVKEIRAACAALALLATAWLVPASAMASDPDAAIRKAFPALYVKVHPEMMNIVRVATLDVMLRKSLYAAKSFYDEKGHYPATVAELTSHIDGADRFAWVIHGGGGKVFPTFRVESRDDDRVVGSATEGMIHISAKATVLQKRSTCHASTYMRDFLRDADAPTGKHFMQIIGAPAEMSREKLLANMNEGVTRNCSLERALKH